MREHAERNEVVRRNRNPSVYRLQIDGSNDPVLVSLPVYGRVGKERISGSPIRWKLAFAERFERVVADVVVGIDEPDIFAPACSNPVLRAADNPPFSRTT